MFSICKVGLMFLTSMVDAWSVRPDASVRVIRWPETLVCADAEVRRVRCGRAGNGSVGQWVMGQMGHHFWMGHMGHESLPVTH